MTDSNLNQGDEPTVGEDATHGDGESFDDDEPWANAPDPPDSLGLARGTVDLVDHREAWHAAFERERERLQATLGADAVAIAHVGSTAVRGLLAKPILDVAVGVPDLDTARAHRDRGTLADLGYAYRETDAVADRLFFARGPPTRRTHYVSLTPVDGATFREQVAFRDALRANADLRSEYADLKRELAGAHAEEREQYTTQKSAFVERVLANHTDVGVTTGRDTESDVDGT
jgi:GrpB-like predicted nucleotidyltransferase (UPF0157 family)